MNIYPSSNFAESFRNNLLKKKVFSMSEREQVRGLKIKALRLWIQN